MHASGFAVVDLETTGLFPERHDRIVEAAVVMLDERACPEGEWASLINPCRDVGPTVLHGITASDVVDAPMFVEVAGDLAERLGDRVVVGHNVSFDLRFLAAEFGVLGADIGGTHGLCTMSLAAQFGGGGRTLRACCEELGIREGGTHNALADAHAAASLLACCLARAGDGIDQVEYPDPLPRSALPSLAPSGRACVRGAPPRIRGNGLGAIAGRLPIAELGWDGDPDALDAYAELLDRVLEDRWVTDEELRLLVTTALKLGMTSEDISRVHRAYLAGVARLALADGMLTAAERADLTAVATLLGVPDALTDLSAVVGAEAVAVDRRGEFAGKRVCFTGASVCSMGGTSLERRDQERLAASAGLVVEKGVTKRLDVLVFVDAASQSGKARHADAYGVRKISERTFWAAVGVRVD